MEHVLLTCSVPTKPNPDSKLSQSLYARRLYHFECLLTHAYVGFTRVDGVGAWKGENGKVQTGPIRVYTIAVSGAPAGHAPDRLRGIICRTLDQRAAYVSVQKLEGWPIGRGDD